MKRENVFLELLSFPKLRRYHTGRGISLLAWVPPGTCSSSATWSSRKRDRPVHEKLRPGVLALQRQEDPQWQAQDSHQSLKSLLSQALSRKDGSGNLELAHSDGVLLVSTLSMIPISCQVRWFGA